MTLSIDHLCYRVNGNEVIHDFSARAEPGELIGIIGPNGAGKSTLANIITGFLSASSGGVRLSDQLLSGQAPDRIARMGISRTFQSQHLPWNLPVHQCVLASMVAANSNSSPEEERSLNAPENNKAMNDRASWFIARMGLAPVSLKPARDLSYGQQKILALTMALARPFKVLILDEPFTGLRSTALDTVITVVRKEARERIVLIIDHALSSVREVASRLWFMIGGELVEFESYDQMVVSDVFIRGYLGGENASSAVTRSSGEVSLADATPNRQVREASAPTKRGPVLSLKGMSVGYSNEAVVSDINLQICPGEVICIVGMNGSGKSTLLRGIIGLARLLKGEIHLRGHEVSEPTPDKMAREGVKLLIQDQRLFHGLSLEDNLLLSAAGTAAPYQKRRWFPLSSGESIIRMAKCAEAELREEGIQFAERLAKTYSGGEQARVALKQMGFGDPDVLLLDEPTSGLDGAALGSLRTTLSSFRSRGGAVLMIEHTLDFVISNASRILILAGGRLHDLPQYPISSQWLLNEILERS